MGFVEGFVRAVTIGLGGAILAFFVVASVFCGLAGLLTLSEENRPAFKLISKITSYMVIGFALLLPLRSFSLLPVALALWWAAILRGFAPAWRIVQAGVAALLSLAFWVPHIASSRAIVILDIGDVTLFLIMPVVVSLIQLSSGAESLTGAKSEPGPRVPLHKLLSAMARLLASAFPARG